jgi:hypothetical protein
VVCTFPYFHCLVILKLKFLIMTNVAQATQLGRLTNEVNDALSHPPNSIASHNALHAFTEVSLVLNFPTGVYFCVKGPQECSTAGVSLQLHRRRRCGPSNSTTADVGPSQHADHRGGKAPHAPSPVVSAEESDEGINVDVYLYTAMFTTQPVRIFLLSIYIASYLNVLGCLLCPIGRMRLEVPSSMMHRLRLKRHHHVHADANGEILPSKVVTSYRRSGLGRRRHTHPAVEIKCAPNMHRRILPTVRSLVCQGCFMLILQVFQCFIA